MISVGQGAKTDPILAYSSVMASELLKYAAQVPRSRRRKWLRDEMNKTNPGIGDTVMRKADELTRRHVRPNQAMFDALRLAIANQLAGAIDKTIGAPVSGLGTSEADINAVFCGIMGSATVGGSIYTSASSNPTGSTAVAGAGSAAMTAAGCNTGALQQQARIAEANARIAEAAAHGTVVPDASGSAGDNTMLYVAIGGAAVVAVIGGALLLRRK